MSKQLKGQDLANAYAKHLAQKLEGNLTGWYLGGGWIEVSGHCNKVHPDLKDKYPKGWSLLTRKRSGAIRKELGL